MTGKHLVLRFWDNVDMNKPLFCRFHYLNNCFVQTIMDLSKDLDIREGLVEKAKRIKWIINLFSQWSPGPRAKKDFLSVKYTLGKYNALKYLADKNKTMVSLQQMEEQGLGETTYVETLRKLSSFLAWTYNLEVPRKIRKIYEKQQEEENDFRIPAIELELVDEDDMVANTSCRFPLLIIVDNSIPMGENRWLDTIKQGLTQLAHKIYNCPELSRCIELYVATCGGTITEITNFAMIERQMQSFDNLVLKPYGQCKMADAINQALDRLQQRIDKFSDPHYGIKYYKPQMLILSIGKFKGDMQKAVSRIQEQSGDLQVYARGVSKTAHMDNLKALDPGAIILDNLEDFFNDFFVSLKKAKTSKQCC